MTGYKPGDKVRLRDGVLPWRKRDGWTVEDVYGSYVLIVDAADGATLAAAFFDIEPEVPSPWAPTPGSDMRQAVTEAIGAASVTWHEDGVFDDEAALWVADGLVAWLTEAHGQNIEPDSAPIPPEPPRVVGQAWLDADGGLVQTDNVEGSPLAYILTGTESVVRWQDLAHPLTTLYPVPDPNDAEAVEAVSGVVYSKQVGQYRSDVTWSVRAVLRALRGGA